MAQTDTISHQETAEYGCKVVKNYDFKKALRLSIDQIRVLSKMHETCAYQLSSTLSTQFKSIVQVDLISVHQMQYEEYIQQLPTSTILTVYEAVGLEKRVALNMNPVMAFALIDRLMGGKGSFEENIRESITPIETNILKRMLEGVILNLQKAWGDIIPLKLKATDVKTNPQFLQLVNPSDTVVVVTFEISIEGNVEQMVICLPYELIEPHVSKLSGSNGIELKRDKDSGLLQNQIEHLTVPVSVELGRASITIEEFLGLAVNDVLQLNQLADEPLQVKINEQVKFLAHPGTKKSRMAIKIEHVIEGEEKNDG